MNQIVNSELNNSSIKHQDIVNNNHIDVINNKQAYMNKQLNNRNQHKDDESAALFDSEIFTRINVKDMYTSYDKFDLVSKNNEYWFDLGDNLIVRPLKRNDYERDYLKLLGQLTVVGEISKEQFEERFDSMRACSETYYIVVIEDTLFHKIVGTGTFVYEQKFIRGAGARGRFEDLVVDETYRGKKLSKVLIDMVCQLGAARGCYKLSLECKDHLIKLYQQFGFKHEENQNYLCKRA
jgi:glucosamine-phosphate N-acetyltransferase